MRLFCESSFAYQLLYRPSTNNTKKFLFVKKKKKISSYVAEQPQTLEEGEQQRLEADIKIYTYARITFKPDRDRPKVTAALHCSPSYGISKRISLL